MVCCSSALLIRLKVNEVERKKAKKGKIKKKEFQTFEPISQGEISAGSDSVLKLSTLACSQCL